MNRKKQLLIHNTISSFVYMTVIIITVYIICMTASAVYNVLLFGVLDIIDICLIIALEVGVAFLAALCVIIVLDCFDCRNDIITKMRELKKVDEDETR